MSLQRDQCWRTLCLDALSETWLSFCPLVPEVLSNQGGRPVCRHGWQSSSQLARSWAVRRGPPPEQSLQLSPWPCSTLPCSSASAAFSQRPCPLLPGDSAWGAVPQDFPSAVQTQVSAQTSASHRQENESTACCSPCSALFFFCIYVCVCVFVICILIKLICIYKELFIFVTFINR